jgi:hypothetical protein
MLDARLLQEGKQRLQLLQLVLPECICDCCLGLLPQGIGARNSFLSLLGDLHHMLSPIESFAHCYKAVTLQDTQISSDGRAITSQFLGKLGDALLCFTPKNTLQKHILSDLQTTGCKSSVIDLSERLRCVADSCAGTGKCPLHDVSIYPHLANVKGLSELSTQKCDFSQNNVRIYNKDAVTARSVRVIYNFF